MLFVGIIRGGKNRHRRNDCSIFQSSVQFVFTRALYTIFENFYDTAYTRVINHLHTHIFDVIAPRRGSVNRSRHVLMQTIGWKREP